MTLADIGFPNYDNSSRCQDKTRIVSKNLFVTKNVIAVYCRRGKNSLYDFVSLQTLVEINTGNA